MQHSFLFLMNSINSLFALVLSIMSSSLLSFFFSPFASDFYAFVSPPSLCPLELWLKMNCWLQVAPAVLRERRALWWQITAKRVGDGLNCFSHMVTCFLSSLPSFSLPLSLVLATCLFFTPLPGWNCLLPSSSLIFFFFSLFNHCFFKPGRDGRERRWRQR